MSDLVIAGIALVVLLVMVLCSVPIAVALLLSSFVAMAFLTSTDIAISLLASTTYNAVHSYIFAVVPLFVLMGTFMARSNAAGYLYAFLYAAFSWVRGGLAVSTVFSNAVFAAVSGTSVASAAVFSRIALPEMERYGYSRRLALGAVAGSSILGMLIPPSLLLILYGILTQVSIGSLFIAGVVPGLVLAVAFSLAAVIIGTVNPAAVGRRPDPVPATGPVASGAAGDGDVATGWAEKVPASTGALPAGETAPKAPENPFLALAGSIPVIGLIVVVLGGIWGGWFTPMEASAVGAVGAFIIGKAMGMSWRNVGAAFRDAVVTTGAIMILIIGALLYSRMLAASGLITAAGDLIIELDIGPMLFVFVCVVMVVLLGAILDSASILVLVIPMIHPTVLSLGIEPIWFAIIMVIAVEAGLLTPPFGIIPFTMVAVVGGSLRAEEVFRGALPFLLCMFAVLALLFAFPDIVTWLPGLMLGG